MVDCDSIWPFHRLNVFSVSHGERYIDQIVITNLKSVLILLRINPSP